ncbi:OmpH family outer membrane protein [Planctomycetota bacterium]
MNKLAVTAGVMILLAGLLAVSHQEKAAAGNGGDFKIGFVNFRKVFNEYDETIRINEKMKGMQVRAEQKMNSLTQQYKALSDELKLLRQNNPEYAQKEKELIILKANIEFEQKQIESDLMKYLLTQTERIYLEIREAIAEYGKTHGYTIILKVDAMDLTAIRSQSLSSLNEKIQTRPVLYYDKKYDLSQAVIDILNEK